MGFALDWTTRPPGTVFRPDVVFNRNTGKYVLFWNQVAPNGTYLGFIAATADAPQGPFTIVGPVPLTHSNDTYHAGDFKLFVDDDGTGYIIYGAEFYMWIDKLSPDYLSTTGEFTGPVGNIYFVEDPALIKRDGVYLALFDHCCCFCMQGSGIRVYEASNPLGPWTAQGGDLACVPPSGGDGETPSSYRDAALGGVPTPGQGCLYNGSTYVSTTRSQQSGITIVNTTAGQTFLWAGDRWQQSPDGIKGHDPQFWVPLVFDGNGVVQPVKWVDNFTIDLV
jgi:beta-xylosidase